MSLSITLIENDVKSLKDPMHEEIQRAIKHFEKELAKVRHSRAHTSMIEDVPVSIYGQPPAPLKTMAALSAPEPRLLTIQPWDASIIANIEKAITTSDLGLSPRNDGKIILLQLPEMSTNRREELVRILGKKLEECKISIRNIRKDFQNAIRDAKRNSTISEDFSNRLSEILQEIINNFIKQAELLADKKKVLILE